MNPSSAYTKNWVLLRGLTRSKFHWLDFPLQLKEGFKSQAVFCPELAGNGERCSQITPSSINGAVEDLRKQVPDSVKDEGFSLFSISLGSMIAKRWSELYPKEIKSMVLINTSYKNLSPFYHRMLLSGFLEIVRSYWIKDFETKERIILDRTCNNKERQKFVLKTFTDFHKNHPIKFQSIVHQILISQQARFVTRPSCPCLILSSKKDHLVSSKCSQKLAETFELPIQTHPNAGHDLILDDPAWVLNKLTEFFN